MSEALQAALGVAAIVLAALVVGALVPVLLEARATLRRARRLLDDAGPRVIATLDDVSGVMAKLDGLAADLEPRVQALAASLDEVHKVLRVTAALGAAIGPAVSAAVQGYQAARRNGHGGATNDAPAEAVAPRGSHDGG